MSAYRQGRRIGGAKLSELAFARVLVKEARSKTHLLKIPAPIRAWPLPSVRRAAGGCTWYAAAAGITAPKY
jgi:hypothetical protein